MMCITGTHVHQSFITQLLIPDCHNACALTTTRMRHPPATRSITAQASSAGWGGFWKGNMLNVVRTAPFKAVNYFTFDTILRFLVHRGHGEHHGYERFIAGAGAGVFATMTCFPLDVLRTRMMSPAHAQTVGQTLWHMIAHEGLGSFYTGCSPALMSMAMGGAVFYGTYDWLKSTWLLRRGQDPCALLLVSTCVMHLSCLTCFDCE